MRSRRGVPNCSQARALPEITAPCMALSRSGAMILATCSSALYPNEGWLMDSLDPASPAAVVIDAAGEGKPSVWKFWGTAFWGFVVFAAMFAGQIAVVG